MSAKYAASYLAARYRERLGSLGFRKTGGHGRYDLGGEGTVVEEWTANDGQDVRLVYLEVDHGMLKRAILFEPGEERP